MAYLSELDRPSLYGINLNLFKVRPRYSDRSLMNLHQLFELRGKLLQEFESSFEKMEFTSEEEKQKYYHAFMKGMNGLFKHSMNEILEDDKKAG